VTSRRLAGVDDDIHVAGRAPRDVSVCVVIALIRQEPLAEPGIAGCCSAATLTSCPVVVEPRPQVRQDLLSATVGRRDQEDVSEAILVLPVSRHERRLHVRVGSGHPGLFHS
jgi:hypothetical protein